MSVNKTIRLISWEYFPFNFLSFFFSYSFISNSTPFQWFLFESEQVNIEYVAHSGALCYLCTLKKFKIICAEDLIHEIMTVGPHFKEANNFLWPFKLKASLGGLKKKTILILRNLRKRRRKEQGKKLCKNLNKIRFPFSTTFFLVLY
ncbi:hypothetical protein IC582_010554 [Cucumis melo]